MKNYTPLDEILETPSTRILRALRWFDWVSSPDLMNAAGVPDFVVEYGDNHERNAASAALSRLVRSGYVERGVRLLDGYTHRITKAGLRELKLRLRGSSPLLRRATRGSKRRAG